MNSLLDSWLLKVEDVSNSIQAKEQQLRAQVDENEELESVLSDELRRKTVACKNLYDLRIQHAQLHSKALLCVGKGHASSHTSRDGVRSAEIIQRQQSLAASFGREAEQMQTFTALIEGHLHDTIAQSNTQKADLSEALRKQTAAEAEVSELNSEVLRWDQDRERHAAQCEALQHELCAITEANTVLAQKIDLLHAEDHNSRRATAAEADHAKRMLDDLVRQRRAAEDSSRKAKAAVADLIARQAAVDRELGSIQLSLKAFCTDE